MWLLWAFIALAVGWRIGTTATFWPVYDKDVFHSMLLLSDTTPLASTQFEFTKRSDKAGSTGGHDKNERSMASRHVEEGAAKIHQFDSAKKGHSDKEKHLKSYGEESGNGEKLRAHGAMSRGHHSNNEKDYSHKFRDRLLHKTGNYEKGYHDKYHLDEVVKHHKFWSDHHSLDKTHKYGRHDSSFTNRHNGQSNKKHKQVKDENEKEAKKGDVASGHSTSDEKGHKSEAGMQSKYMNNVEHRKNN